MGFDQGAFFAGLLGGFAQTSTRLLMEGESRRFNATSQLIESVIKSGDTDAYAGLAPSISKMFGKDFLAAGSQATARNRQILDTQKQFQQQMIGNIWGGGEGPEPDFATAPGPRGGGPAGVPGAAAVAEASGGGSAITSVIGQLVGAGGGVDAGPAGGAEPPVVERSGGGFGALPGPLAAEQPLQFGGVPATGFPGAGPQREPATPIRPATAQEVPPEQFAPPPTVAPPPARTSGAVVGPVPEAGPGPPRPATAEAPGPRSEARPGAGVALPPDDAAATKWLTSQVTPRGLPPGTSASVTSGGVTVSRSGTETLADAGRKLLSAGVRIGATPVAIADAAAQRGYPIDEKALQAYGDRQAEQTYRKLLPAMATELGLVASDPAVQRAAAHEVFERTGHLTKRLETLAFPSRADREAEITRRVEEDFAAGVPALEIIRHARANRWELTADAETDLKTRQMGKVFQAAIDSGETPDRANQLAQASVGYDQKAMKGFAAETLAARPPADLSGDVKGALAEQSGVNPRFPKPGDVRAAREQVRAEGVEQVGAESSARTTAAKRAELAVPERAPTTEVAKVTAVRDVIDATREIVKTFDPERVGIGQETLGDLLTKVGGKTPEDVAFRAKVRALTNQIIRTEAGLTQSTGEEARQKLVVPLLGLPSSAFIPRLVGIVENQRSRALNIARGMREQIQVAPDLGDMERYNPLGELREKRFQQLLPRHGGDKAKVYEQMRQEGY